MKSRKKPTEPPPSVYASSPPPASTSELVRFGVSVERPLLDAFDQHLARRGYENRSEALRDLVRAELTRDAWDRGDQAIATISIIYDHHVRELTERLIEIQHEQGERVISATHVHLDHDHCLEVVLAKGPANQLKRLADRLIGAKGVISGEVSGMAIVGRPHAGHGHGHDHDHAPAADGGRGERQRRVPARAGKRA
jgi:CopG family nickel-responsive transcriptional regulator